MIQSTVPRAVDPVFYYNVCSCAGKALNNVLIAFVCNKFIMAYERIVR